MKIVKQILPFLLLVIIIVAAAAAVISFLPRNTENQVSKQAASTPTSVVQASEKLPVQSPELAPGSTVLPLPTPFPSIQWSETPGCANRPQAVDAATQPLMAPSAGSQPSMDFRRASLLSPKLAQLQPAEVNSMMAPANNDASGQKAFVGLAINIATGRLNRETEVSFANLPDVKTTGDLFDRLEGALTGEPPAPALVQAAQQVQTGKGITRAVCGHLLMTKAGSEPADLRWSANGVNAKALTVQGLAANQPAQPRPAVDTVTASPDGRWAAFTSIGNDAGGPVFLLNLKTGEWINLIDKANQVTGQNPLPSDWWWDVIGWMPDSQRLVISSADVSAVFILDAQTGKYQAAPFNGGGLGGGKFLGLAPDGSQFVYTTSSENGSEQVMSSYDLASGQSNTLVRLPIADGVLYYPRYSPDGRYVAYVVQKGQPQTGLSYAIMLYAFDKQLSYIVAEGNLGLTVPTWSPDGLYLAFTRKNVDEPDQVNPDKPFDQPGVNVWVASMTTGKLEQLTFVNGTARRPVWNSDAKTLSFVTHDGQVGLVAVDQPGKIWRAADSSLDAPEFTSVFFVP